MWRASAWVGFLQDRWRQQLSSVTWRGRGGLLLPASLFAADMPNELRSAGRLRVRMGGRGGEDNCRRVRAVGKVKAARF